jgi:hypothetical protein
MSYGISLLLAFMFAYFFLDRWNVDKNLGKNKKVEVKKAL